MSKPKAPEFILFRDDYPSKVCGTLKLHPGRPSLGFFRESMMFSEKSPTLNIHQSLHFFASSPFGNGLFHLFLKDRLLFTVKKSKPSGQYAPGYRAKSPRRSGSRWLCFSVAERVFAADCLDGWGVLGCCSGRPCFCLGVAVVTVFVCLFVCFLSSFGVCQLLFGLWGFSRVDSRRPFTSLLVAWGVDSCSLSLVIEGGQIMSGDKTRRKGRFGGFLYAELYEGCGAFQPVLVCDLEVGESPASGCLQQKIALDETTIICGSKPPAVP